MIRVSKSDRAMFGEAVSHSFCQSNLFHPIALFHDAVILNYLSKLSSAKRPSKQLKTHSCKYVSKVKK